MFSLCVRVLSGSPAFALKTAVAHSGAQTTASAGGAVTEKESVLASRTASSRWAPSRPGLCLYFLSPPTPPMCERRAASNCE